MNENKQPQEEINHLQTQLEKLDQAFYQEEKCLTAKEESLFNQRQDLLTFLDRQHDAYRQYLNHQDVEQAEGWTAFQQDLYQMKELAQERYNWYREKVSAERDAKKSAYSKKRLQLEDDLECLKRKEC